MASRDKRSIMTQMTKGLKSLGSNSKSSKTRPQPDNDEERNWFDEAKASVLFHGYIRGQLDDQMHFPKDIILICVDFFVERVPKFYCFNATVDYRTGVIQANKAKQESFVISTVPLIPDGGTHVFKFGFLITNMVTGWGFITKQSMDKACQAVLDGSIEPSKVSRLGGTQQQRLTCFYGTNTFITVITITADFANNTISFRNHKNALVSTSFTWSKEKQYHAMITFHGKETDKICKFQFLRMW